MDGQNVQTNFKLVSEVVEHRNMKMFHWLPLFPVVPRKIYFNAHQSKQKSCAKRENNPTLKQPFAGLFRLSALFNTNRLSRIRLQIPLSSTSHKIKQPQRKFIEN